jgi:hypothetical protein
LYDSSNNLRGLLFINNTGGVFSTGIRTGNYWLDLDASGTSQNAIRMFTGTGGIGTGTERMRIDASGNVGIGTTSPAGTLDIGKNNATPSLVIGNSAYGANFNSVWGLQSGAQSIMIFGNNGQNEIRAGNTGVGGYLDFYTNNTASFTTASNGNFVMRLSSGGNVGIGTTSPGFRLDVAGAASDWATRFYSNAGASAYFAHGGGYGGYINAGSNASSSTYLLELISNGSTRVYVRGDGSVGIGTTSPATKLHVDASGHALVVSNDTGNRRIYFGTGAIGEPDIQATLSNGTARELSINAAGGNVGIGVVGPSQKLHVAGNVRVTGAYYDSNNEAGSANNFLTSTGTGTDWKSQSDLGLVDGSGTANMVAKWSDANTLTDSGIEDTSSYVSIGRAAFYSPSNYGTAYSTVTGASGGTAWFDTVTASSARLYNITIFANPNSSGSGSYKDFYYGKIIVGNGYNGSAVVDFINYHQESPQPRSLYASGGGNLTVTAVFVYGGSEVTEVPSGATYIIRIKISGYVNAGAGTQINLQRIM